MASGRDRQRGNTSNGNGSSRNGSGKSGRPAKPPSPPAGRPPAKSPPAKPTAGKPRRSKRFELNDIGNGQRLVAKHGERFRFIPAWDCFLTWDGRRWKPDDKAIRLMSFAKQAVSDIKVEAKAAQAEASLDPKDKGRAAIAKSLKSFYTNSASRPRLEAMISLAKSEPGVSVDHTSLDANQWILNTQSRTIDLKTGKPRNAAQRDLITKVAPVEFNPNAKCPLWEKFLLTSLPDPDVREFLQRFVGYCLTGDVSERVFCIFYGGGRNGKSVFLNTIQKLLGPYATTSAPGLLMARENEAHSVEVADLFGVRVAVANEVKKGRSFDEEQVKRLTGGDVLKARRMRENFWSFPPTHKLIIAVNHKPRVRDDSEGFWDRVALIPFTVRIPENKIDRKLSEKLRKELPGILNWAIEGCLRWQKQGLQMPDVIRDATKEYREGEDKVGKFVSECLKFGEGRDADGREFNVTNAELATRAKAWSDMNNMKYGIPDKDLAEKLEEMGCKRSGNVIRQGNKEAGQAPKRIKARGWIGVRIWDEPAKPEASDRRSSQPPPAKKTTAKPRVVVPMRPVDVSRDDSKRRR